TVGNTYELAVGPTQQATSLTQSIYYAKNIAAAGAGSNSVKVTYNGPASFADIRIVEYSGIDPTNPVDVVKAATGNNATASSGTVTTTNANDLIVGANMVATLTTGPGTGFTSRIITNPDGDIEEDRVVTATGSYGATSPMNSSGDWIMQMVAFRGAVAGG